MLDVDASVLFAIGCASRARPLSWILLAICPQKRCPEHPRTTAKKVTSIVRGYQQPSGQQRPPERLGSPSVTALRDDTRRPGGDRRRPLGGTSRKWYAGLARTCASEIGGTLVHSGLEFVVIRLGRVVAYQANAGDAFTYNRTCHMLEEARIWHDHEAYLR